jgi:signal peptidase II
MRDRLCDWVGWIASRVLFGGYPRAPLGYYQKPDAGAISHRSTLWGRFTALGLAVAVATAVLDQASKLWLIFVTDLAARGPIALTPFLDLELQWNKGISYGLFPQEGPVGQWALLAIKVIAAVLLWIWLARASSRLTALALGLIIGGAIGNAIDPLAHNGGVADFVHFHIKSFNFSWYVFNLADVAIVAGVAGLLYEMLLGGEGAKT